MRRKLQTWGEGVKKRIAKDSPFMMRCRNYFELGRKWRFREARQDVSQLHFGHWPGRKICGMQIFCLDELARQNSAENAAQMEIKKAVNPDEKPLLGFLLHVDYTKKSDRYTKKALSRHPMDCKCESVFIEGCHFEVLLHKKN